MKNKIALVSLALILGFSLSACSEKKTTPPADQNVNLNVKVDKGQTKESQNVSIGVEVKKDETK